MPQPSKSLNSPGIVYDLPGNSSENDTSSYEKNVDEPELKHNAPEKKYKKNEISDSMQTLVFEIENEALSEASISSLEELRHIASEEAKHLNSDNGEEYEEKIFQPPNSPKKNSIDILKEMANLEAMKLKRENMQAYYRRSPIPQMKREYKLSRTYPQIKDDDDYYGSEERSLINPTSIAKRPRKKKPASKSENIANIIERDSSISQIDEDFGENENNLKSFNDFDDSIFQFDEETKKYFCPKPGCDKAFPSLSRIKRHYIIHTDIKPFRCENPGCNKRFSRKDNMLQHFRVHCPYTTNNLARKKHG